MDEQQMAPADVHRRYARHVPAGSRSEVEELMPASQGGWWQWPSHADAWDSSIQPSENMILRTPWKN